MPTISVIVPVYKVEPYLKRCIDSILCQTFTDFELILVDDGSPDRCGEICDEYAKKDSRIYVIHKENGGLSSARNRGIDRAFQSSDSKFLSFIDSDDYVHPSFLEYLYKALIENDVKISVCKYEIIHNEKEAFEKEQYSSYIVDAISLYTDKNNYVYTINAWNKLYEKNLFKEMRYPLGKLYEDAFTTYKLLYEAGKVAMIDLPLYKYFVREGSIMHKKTYTVKDLDEIEAYRLQSEFFKDKHKGAYLTAQSALIYQLGRYLGMARTQENLKPFKKEWKTELKYVIKENKKELDFSIMKTPEVYSELYPVTIKICYLIKRIIAKIKRELKKIKHQ